MGNLKTEMRPMLQRMEQAWTDFTGDIVEQFGFTQEQAEEILRVYRMVKAVKYDAAMGKYNLIHGALWEREPMENALRYTVTAQEKKAQAKEAKAQKAYSRAIEKGKKNERA